RHGKLLERNGPTIWATMGDDPPAPTGSHRDVTALLLATVELDQLGDRLASWAVNRAGRRPATKVAEVVTDVAHRLATLGVPPPPPTGLGSRPRGVTPPRPAAGGFPRRSPPAPRVM